MLPVYRKRRPKRGKPRGEAGVSCGIRDLGRCDDPVSDLPQTIAFLYFWKSDGGGYGRFTDLFSDHSDIVSVSGAV